MKTALRWGFYVLLFLCAAGLVEQGTSGAIGLLSGVLVWATLRLLKALAEIRDALAQRP